MSTLGILAQMLEIIAAVLAAPLLLGWVNQCRAWLQNRRGPGLLQPWRGIRKLFHKDAVLAENASTLFRAAPYVVFGTMVLAAAIIPSMAMRLPLSIAADSIALVGLLATARVFLALAAMDVGTAFGTLGARREMMIGFLAEPALLMVIFLAAMISHTTSLAGIAESLTGQELALYPSAAFTAVAFLLVLLAENARIPVDNPATHLELTMVHEAMLLEYSGRYLAFMEWGASIKQLVLMTLLLNVFVPVGLAGPQASAAGLGLSLLAYLAKLLALSAAVVVVETTNAKLRLFRVPDLLSAAFVLATLALLSTFLFH